MAMRARTAIALLKRPVARQIAPVAHQIARPRALCVNLRKSEGGVEDGWFAKQEREALEKLKATMAKKKKPIDEADEKVRLQKIIEAVGVREAIREELTVKLLLWKVRHARTLALYCADGAYTVLPSRALEWQHDEDLTM